VNASAFGELLVQQDSAAPWDPYTPAFDELLAEPGSALP
jgi:hypothetical protein